jgi:hypothetical protein
MKDQNESSKFFGEARCLNFENPVRRVYDGVKKKQNSKNIVTNSIGDDKDKEKLVLEALAGSPELSSSVAEDVLEAPVEDVDDKSNIFNLKINADGLVYSGDKRELINFINESIKNYSPGDWRPENKSINTIIFGEGVSISFVEEMQRKLGFSGKDVDGKVGPKTLGRLKKFIENNGILDEKYAYTEEYGLRNFRAMSTNFLNAIFQDIKYIKDGVEYPVLANMDGRFDQLYKIMDDSLNFRDMAKDDLLFEKDIFVENFVQILLEIVNNLSTEKGDVISKLTALSQRNIVFQVVKQKILNNQQ